VKRQCCQYLVQIGAQWCNMMIMARNDKVVRKSISIPARIAHRVRGLAKAQKTSANRVLVALLQAGLESKESEKTRFFALADQLSKSHDPKRREKLKRELARMTFGE
jgi:hypothetical protein